MYSDSVVKLLIPAFSILPIVCSQKLFARGDHLMTMIGSFSECDRFSRKAGATMVCQCTSHIRYDRIFRILF